VQSYLVGSGTYSWYLEQSHSLSERLNTARTTTLDRGSRILTYYRLLAEYRKLNASWATKKQQAGTFLALSEKAKSLKSPSTTPVTIPAGYKSDQQIADEILANYKL
jgi:hypothetical protein